MNFFFLQISFPSTLTKNKAFSWLTYSANSLDWFKQISSSSEETPMDLVFFTIPLKSSLFI